MKKMKMRSWVDSVAAVASIVFLGYSSYSAAACGGGGGSYSTPSSPSSSSSSSAGAVTVTIVSSAGNGAFSPNPIQAATGATVMWKNNTSDTHHLVMDDGSAVIGDIPPGGSSTPMPSRSANYHCTNHPSMVGSINGAVAPTPPPGSGDGY